MSTGKYTPTPPSALHPQPPPHSLSAPRETHGSRQLTCAPISRGLRVGGGVHTCRYHQYRSFCKIKVRLHIIVFYALNSTFHSIFPSLSHTAHFYILWTFYGRIFAPSFAPHCYICTIMCFCVPQAIGHSISTPFPHTPLLFIFSAINGHVFFAIIIFPHYNIYPRVALGCPSTLVPPLLLAIACSPPFSLFRSAFFCSLLLYCHGIMYFSSFCNPMPFTQPLILSTILNCYLLMLQRRTMSNAVHRTPEAYITCRII